MSMKLGAVAMLLALAGNSYGLFQADIQFTGDTVNQGPVRSGDPVAGQVLTRPFDYSSGTGASLVVQDDYTDIFTGTKMPGKSAVLSSSSAAADYCNFWAALANNADKLTSGVEYVSFDFLYDRGYVENGGGGNAWITLYESSWNGLGNAGLTLANNGTVYGAAGALGSYTLGAVNHLMLKVDMTNKTMTTFINGGQIGGSQAITGSDFGLLGIALAGSYTGSLAIDNILISAVPEPATLSILGLGAAALFRKRRS